MLVALELTKTHTKKNWEVLVVLRDTGRYNKVLWVSRVLIVEHGESFFYLA